ncbi:hypothetical protein [Microbacterium paraoxydans]|uniref:hypothetical protein n=1 Tax=Microbacterium paraoxydans TaxID=199592 RepID=UPI003D72A994
MPTESHPFRDRPLFDDEFEALRLMLSTFRDGTGQVMLKDGRSMPGFRDFERATAAVTYGQAREDKGIFDVWVPTSTLPFGVSCKMAVSQPRRNECSFMELSNSLAYFHTALNEAGVDFERDPATAGQIIVDLVMTWHSAVRDEVDLAGSRYAILTHDSRWDYFQLQCFPLDLRIADPTRDVRWVVEGRALNGYIDLGSRVHRLWQWYGYSGGQLKYYPLLDWVEWMTVPFQLEHAPVASLRTRAIDYFGDLWPRSMAEEPGLPDTATA